MNKMKILNKKSIENTHILELKITVTELRKSLEGFNSSLDQGGEKKSLNMKRSFEIIKTKEQEENSKEH